MNGKLLRAEEVAELLAISKSFAYRLMRSGEIPTLKIGRAVRVREQDLIDFVSENTQVNNYSTSANLLAKSTATSFPISGLNKGD